MLHRAFLDNKPSKVNHQKKFIETVLLQFGTKQIHNLQSIRNPDTIKIAANYHNQKMSKTIFEIVLSRSKKSNKKPQNLNQSCFITNKKPKFEIILGDKICNNKNHF